jgi:two-component system, chemotaxis family, chemotaxis protein CheY
MTAILVVDDASMVRKQVANVLRAAGYSVVEAFDGVDALAKLGDSPAAKLIMLDIHMPNMNGLEFLERLRASGSTIPVIVLTAEAEPEVIRRAKQLGARAWLIKPLKGELLKAAVEKAVPLPKPNDDAPGGGD